MNNYTKSSTITDSNCSVLSLQMFSDYQMQEMSENFIDSFGFQDDEFTDSDMNIRLVNHWIALNGHGSY